MTDAEKQEIRDEFRRAVNTTPKELEDMAQRRAAASPKPAGVTRS